MKIDKIPSDVTIDKDSPAVEGDSPPHLLGEEDLIIAPDASPVVDGEVKSEKAKGSDDLDFLVCEKCATAVYVDEGVKKCLVCDFDLNEAVVVKAIEGRLDFKEGDKGTGVLQIHEGGLSEDQAHLLGDRFFGWEPVKLTSSQLSRLSELHSANWGSLLKKAADGDSKALASAVKKIDREGLSQSDRKLIALVDPVSIHTDFRLRPEGANYWEGGEGFTPGNQFKPNGFKQIAQGDLPSTDKILGNFKIPRKGEDKGEGLSADRIRGPIAWMGLGKMKPELLPPDAPGSTSEAWARLKIVDSFKWRAGVQDQHFKEFEFEGNTLKGRWVFQFVPVTGGRREWMISRPKDQEFKADKKESEEKEDVEKNRSFVVEIAKAEKRLVTGIVLQPEVPDGQGEIYSYEVVENACYSFMEAFFERKAALGIQHKDYTRDLELVENYIAPSDMIINGHSVRAGSWIMTIRVNDDEIWKRVKQGELTGLSIKGRVRVVNLEAA